MTDLATVSAPRTATAPMQQVHAPEQFNVAWKTALLSTGKGTGVSALDSTVWIEANAESTTFTAANQLTIVAVTIPTVQPGSDWRAIVRDPGLRVKNVASIAGKADPLQMSFDLDDMQARTVRITNDGVGSVSFSLSDSADFAASALIVDAEWPHDYLNMLHNDVEAPGIMPTVWSAPPVSLEFLAKIGGQVGVLDLVWSHTHGGALTFDVDHPNAPDIHVKGRVLAKSK